MPSYTLKTSREIVQLQDQDLSPPTQLNPEQINKIGLNRSRTYIISSNASIPRSRSGPPTQINPDIDQRH